MDKENDSYDLQKYLDEHVADYQDKELRIINAAINSFSEKGFEATRTKEIAQRAGIAEGTIFRYFPTKDAILERMVPLLIRIVRPKIEKPIQDIINENMDTPIDKLYEVLLLDRLKMVRDNGRFIKSVLPELIYRAPLLNQLQESILPMIQIYMQKVLQRGKDRGEIREDIDADIVLYQMLGFVLSYSMVGGSKSEEEMKKDVAKFLKYLMEGWRR